MKPECAIFDIKGDYDKYKFFWECALDIFFLVDLNGNILDANNAAIKEYGYPIKQLLSMNISDLRVPGERAAMRSQLREAFEHGSMFQTVHERRDGSTFPVEINARGAIVNGKEALLCVVRDITKRLEVEQLKSRCQAIVEHSDDAIIGMTLDGIITEWNHGAEKLYGYTAGEIVGKSVGTLIPKTVKNDFQKIAEVIKQGRGLTHYDTERITKDGKTIIVSLTASPIKSQNGEILGISWVARDITERKRVEAELQRKAILIDLSPDAIMVRQPEGMITFWSKGAESLYGWTSKDAVGKNTETLLKTNYSEPIEQINRQLMDTGYWSGELTHFTKDGRPVIMQSRWLARFYSNHSIREILESNVDVTDRKKAEEALQDAKAQAELYVDLMGHDINNLNQVAIGFLEIALESFHLTDEEREFLDKPLDALVNSSTLIENVRKLQKIGEGSLKYRKTDLCDIIQKVKNEYSHVPGRDVAINFEDIPYCYVFANDLIKDVFANLVGNAIKHSDPQKPLMINISVEPVIEKGKDYFKIIVEDNGPGILDGLKNKLFMRFQRGDTKASGKGLGLYLVRTLVADFQGKIWVEDRVPGDYTKGAKFVVMLPAIKN